MPPCCSLQGSPDWDRVVAVIVQGAKWQFKDWQFKVGGAHSGWG
jgi:parafibromin